ncbi:MerR family transcriptional regulator [Streptomyces sp. NPDC059166]|uniref:DNA polymerase III subunit beta family protein n=1 Tax=Streptomyces sp. NPDC059166 TaxID=3346752 RepID=UPI00367D72F7
MPHEELMPIGAFAERSGLTSSALRFYADSGLLPPARVDPGSGYRYYGAGQVGRAVMLRRLRELAMPLASVEAVLDSGGDEASRILDAHVAKVVQDAATVRRKAAAVKSVLGRVPRHPLTVVRGPVLADAVEQVLTASAHGTGIPALTGLRIEVSSEELTLTGTDRYRLSTRTLVPAEPPARTWDGTVDGQELRAAAAASRRSPTVRLEAVPDGLWFRMADGDDRHCRSVPGAFPDHRLLLASLGEVTTRATVSKDVLLRAVEEHPGERVGFRFGREGLYVLPTDDEEPESPVRATVTGRALRVWFEVTTLHPAVSTAIGPDVLLDLRGHDQPVTVRSADRGDLTTLAMPVSPPADLNEENGS